MPTLVTLCENSNTLPDLGAIKLTALVATVPKATDGVFFPN